MSWRRWVIAVVAITFAAGAGARAAAAQTPPEGPSVYPPFASLPGVDDRETAALWRRALELERQRDFAAAAATYEQLAARLPTAASPRWRAAKCHWDTARKLPAHDVAERGRLYAQTRTWAQHGLDVDPQCGECCLYAAAGLGGETRDRGAVAGAMQVSEIAGLLERGIEILSRQPDAERNPELEELYYAAAQLYRAVPDSGMLRWALGVPGDRRRAIAYMRRATELGGQRADYQIELSALLVCTGQAEGDTGLMAEGFALLHAVLARPAAEVDAEDRRRAQAIIDRPQVACES